MDITGWLTGQVFLHSVDEAEVEMVTSYLAAHDIPSQVLTTDEEMVLDSARPGDSVRTTSYSVMAQLAGFPQVLSPVLGELMRRAHGGGWDVEAPPGSGVGLPPED